MRVAIVGGTGDFGLALAARLVEAGDEVVIGPRDAKRAQEKAREVGASGGATNDEAVSAVDLVVLATKADGTLDTAASLAGALGVTPVLCVASDLRSKEPVSLAERTQELVQAPVVAGLHSLAAGKLAHGRPDESSLTVAVSAPALMRAQACAAPRARNALPFESTLQSRCALE